jgi:hypothetical protein
MVKYRQATPTCKLKEMCGKQMDGHAEGNGWRLGDGRLKVHKIENFFDSDFGICVISLLVMAKY